MRKWRSALLLVILVVGACSAGATAPAPSASRSSVLAAPTDGTVPSDLRAEWTTNLTSTNEIVTLTLTDRTYSIKRGSNTGRGQAAVRGNEIAFSGSPLCDGVGTYRWSLNAGVLRFVAASPDPCSGRTEVIEGQTYRRP